MGEPEIPGNRVPAQKTHRDAAFVGRQRELETLLAALDDALSGKGRLVMLAGEPGIGKTRTAQELAGLAEERGARVLWGGCYEHQGAPPYWPWLQSIRSYLETAETAQLRQDMGPGAADISEILSELPLRLEGLERPPALDPEQARFRLFFSITTFLKNVSRSQPLVLVLDDLHWADESSLLLLEFLTREITASPVLILGTYRDNEVSGNHPLARTLGSLVREEHFQRLSLGGLSRQEVGEFVEARAGVPVADTEVDTLYQRTDGNPLFVGEVVGTASPEEITGDPSWADRIPEAVREAILRRLSRLSEPCNRLLRTASVIGRDFDLPLLRALSPEVAESEFSMSIDEAVSIRIIEALPTGLGGYQFGHALIQQAVYDGLPPMRKAEAHSAVGDALEELHHNNLDEHAGELARHFAEAGAVGGIEKMVWYSLIAGEKALETFAYEQALVNFARVLAAKEGLETDAETAAALFGMFQAQAATVPRLELGEAYSNLVRAFDFYASVGDIAHIVAIAEFPRPQLSELGIQGNSLIERALELVSEGSLEAGRIHSFNGNILGMVGGDYQGARDSFDRALAIAKREGNAALEMRTLTFAAQVELWHHHFDDSLKSSLMAIELATAASDHRVEVTARYWAAIASRMLGERQETQRQASAILEPATRLRDRSWLATAHNSVAWSQTLEGDWGSAKEENQRGLALMPLDPRVLMQQVILETQTGDQNEAEIQLERLEGVVQRSGAGPNTQNACLALVSPLARSIFGSVKRPEAGETSITAVLSSPSATPFFSTWARTGAALLAAMNDDTEAAAEQYAALRPSAGLMGIYIHVDRILGLLAGTMGDLNHALLHFQDASAFYRKSGYLPELAWTCHDHAAALLKLGAPGDREMAASLLDEALAISTELGMPPLRQRVEGLIAQMASSGDPTYPDGLTAREVEVLRLVASGKSNRDIAEELVISLRTAANHVANILNKTGLANRTEAAAYAIRQDLV